MARAAALLILVLSLPSVAAGVAFERTWEDPAGDNVATSADVVRFDSSVADGIVTQRVTMAAPPDLDEDTLILRSWFHNSTNGSFHVLDLEVHAHTEGDAKFQALVRRDSFENVTPIEASYAVEEDAWVFTFSESLVADATCFDPIVWVQHEPENGSWSADQGGIGTRYCRVRGDPTPTPSRPPPIAGPTPGPARPVYVAPPGSSLPPISVWTLVGLAAVAAVFTLRIWRRT